MILKPDNDGVITVSFLLMPEYAMMALLSAIEPMRVANRLAERELFRWQLLAVDKSQVLASNGLALQQTQSIHDVPSPDNLFVCSSFQPEKYIDLNTVNWLKKIKRRGAIIGAMDTGCYLLAAASLLTHHRCTLHWEASPAFQEKYPTLEVTNELFEIDKNIITSAGGTSAVDLWLFIIQSNFSHDLAITVCEQFIKSGIRQKSDKQRINLAARLKVHHPRMLRVLAKMEDNLVSPLSTSELADYAHLSVRQLERLFRSHFNDTPSSYYTKLRLDRAQQLLKESHLRISEVSIACGFNTAAHFSRSYRNHFKCTPRDERKIFSLKQPAVSPPLLLATQA